MLSHISFRAAGRRSVTLLAGFALFCLMAAMAPPAAHAAADTLDINAKIHVTTAGEADVTGDYTVDTNGNISMLYINEVHVAGLTVAQANKLLTTKLAQYYRSPQVVVTLLSKGGVGVELRGEVAGQGTQLVRSDSHLADVLLPAGPTGNADLTDVEVTHGLPGTPHTTDHINYLTYKNNNDAIGNPALHDGDVIMVKSKRAVPISVMLQGQVSQPGLRSVLAKTTAYDAIQQAGGLALDANKKGIYLKRANSDDQLPLNYDVAGANLTDPAANPVLNDGDTIIVQKLERPRTYTISGAVHSPTIYPMTTDTISLADAIGQAGGVADRARMKEAYIIRRMADNKTETLKIDATTSEVQGNTLIYPGDNIVIPQGSAQPSGLNQFLQAAGSLLGFGFLFRR